MQEKPYAVWILLPIFGLLAFMALAIELTAERKPYLEERGGEAAVPHSPAEFADVLRVELPEDLASAAEGTDFPVPRPPLSEDYYPCSDCHDPDDDNPLRRELEEDHEDILLVHDEESRWCLDCHDFQDRDVLHLASGETIPFEESHRLCGQCHGTIYRDWKLGIHGRRIGYWDGPKQYVLCVHCHWPHAPRFQPLEPLPPPVRPENIRRRAGEES